MKKWTGLLIAVAVIILGAYDLMGWVAERTLTHNIKALPESPFFSVSLDKYQRGWFSSHALLGFKLHVPPQNSMGANGVAKMGPPIDLMVGFPLLIQHGPIICTENGLRFGMAQVTTRPTTHYGAFINYFNKTILKYTLPAMSLHTEIASEDGYQLDWKGMRVWLGLSPHLKGFEGNLTLGGLSISAKDFAVKVGQIVSETESSRYQEWLWVGHTHLSLPSILVKSTRQTLFELKDFDLNVTSTVEDGSLHFDWQFSLQRLFADNLHYGPASLKLSIRNVDAAAMAKINQQVWNSTARSTGNPELAMMAAMAELSNLMAKGPIIELAEMDLSMPQGHARGHFKFILPQFSLKDSAAFARKIRGEGEFKAPVKVVKALLVASLKRHASPTPPANSREQTLSLDATGAMDFEQQADKILEDYVNKGILKRHGEEYLLTFQLENQQWTVNGQLYNP